MPGRTNISVALTQIQRVDLNRTINRLGMSFAPFVTKAVKLALSDGVRLGELKRRIVNDRDMPRHIRSGSYIASKTVSIRQADVDKMLELSEDYKVSLGAIVRAAVLLSMDERPEIFVSPDKVITKVSRMIDSIGAQPGYGDDFKAKLNEWFANGGASEGWPKQVETLALAMDCEPWRVLVWLHGMAADWMRDRQNQEDIAKND